MQVMTQKASTYQPICLARLPLLRNPKVRWMRFSRSDRDHSDSASIRDVLLFPTMKPIEQ